MKVECTVYTATRSDFIRECVGEGASGLLRVAPRRNKVCAADLSKTLNDSSDDGFYVVIGLSYYCRNGLTPTNVVVVAHPFVPLLEIVSTAVPVPVYHPTLVPVE